MSTGLVWHVGDVLGMLVMWFSGMVVVARTAGTLVVAHFLFCCNDKVVG